MKRRRTSVAEGVGEPRWTLPFGITVYRNHRDFGAFEGYRQWFVVGAPWWISFIKNGPHSAELEVTVGRTDLIRAKPGLTNVPMANHVLGRWWISRGLSTFVQHKGTELCMDVYCPACGDQSHVDSDFVYYLECPHCETVFEVGVRLSLKPVQREDAGGHDIVRAEA
jgi:hypothetical protein